MSIAESLLFSSLDTDVAFVNKQTYKIGTTNGKSGLEMYNAPALYDNRATFESVLITPGWNISVKDHSLLKLRLAT